MSQNRTIASACGVSFALVMLGVWFPGLRPYLLAAGGACLAFAAYRLYAHASRTPIYLHGMVLLALALFAVSALAPDRIATMLSSTPAQMARSTPRGPQAPMITLRSIDALRDAFNAAPDAPRVVALFSPSSPSCLQGASAIESVLSSLPDRDVRAFLVWLPVVDKDALPAADVQARAKDPRATHFWDPTQRLASLWQPVLKTDPKPALGKVDLISGDVLWDFVGVFPPGVQWIGAAPPVPVFKAAPVADHEAELRKALIN